MEAQTNHGTIVMSQTWQFSSNNETHEAALESMGIDEDEIDDEWFSKHQLVVDTSSMSMIATWKMEPCRAPLTTIPASTSQRSSLLPWAHPRTKMAVPICST